MRLRLRLLAVGLCAIAGGAALPAAAAAATTAATAAECTGLPKHSNLPVVDAANVIPPVDEAWLMADLARYQAGGGEAIVAATVRDLGGDDVSSYARRLFECWGVGDAESDNGILILIAMREQRVRIEAGAGLEGRLSEEQLERALDRMVAPLRAGQVATGLRAAAVSMVGDLGGELPDTRAGGDGVMPPGNPGDVQDGDDGDDGAAGVVPNGPPPFAIDDLPRDVAPFRAPGSTGFGFAAVIPLLIFVAIVGSIVRGLFRGGGGGGAWRGGFAAGGLHPGWGMPSVLRGGAWHVSDSPPMRRGGGWGSHDGGWSGGSSSDSSSGSSFGGSSGGSFGASSGGSFGGSSGGSGGSSFGGGSSGGGGASGSW